jgi:hypothetical protein
VKTRKEKENGTRPSTRNIFGGASELQRCPGAAAFHSTFPCEGEGQHRNRELKSENGKQNASSFLLWSSSFARRIRPRKSTERRDVHAAIIATIQLGRNWGNTSAFATGTRAAVRTKPVSLLAPTKNATTWQHCVSLDITTLDHSMRVVLRGRKACSEEKLSRRSGSSVWLSFSGNCPFLQPHTLTSRCLLNVAC